MLGVSRRGVHALAARGDLPGAAKIGAIWTFDPQRLKRYKASLARLAEKLEEIDEFSSAPTGRVYVAGYDHYVKIGFSAASRGARILSLQTSAPKEIKVYKYLPGDIALERALHRKFARYRLKGEWFRNTGRLNEWIGAGCPLPLTEHSAKP
ncbi:Hypothetical protein BN69_1581 [Methylocystis sp. SC2]|nr:Hypothetical protein BN69_1581 [Methylocystis sp. SC2]